MRTGKYLASLSLVAFLLVGVIGCNTESVDTAKNDNAKKKDDHDHKDGDGHDHKDGDEHKDGHKHEHYHPGHYKTGFVYHTDGLYLAVGVMLDAEKDKGTVVITDVPKDNSTFTEQFVAVEEVTVIPPKDSAIKKEFKLVADNTNDDGKASQFVLEDAKLAVVMTGHFTVKFELEEKTYSYEIFPHSH